LEYDVNVSASSDVYLDDALVDIQYASDAEFTQNIVSSGKVSVTLYPEFNNTTYSRFNVGDRRSGIFYVLLFQENSAPKSGRVLIGNTPKKMYHIKMEVKTKNTSTKIAFNTDTLIAFHYGMYSININDDYSIFDVNQCNYISPTANVPLCPLPRVDSISPSTNLIAGRDQIMTIKGKYFGKSRGAGYVSFTSADDTSGIIVNDLDSVDYRANTGSSVETWNDTVIKIKLPSRIYKNNLQDKMKVIGSGPFMVTNNWGNSPSSNITISHNYSTSLYNGKKRVTYLKEGNMNFKIGKTLSADTKAMIERALDEWSCRLNISLMVDSNSSNTIDSGKSPGAMATAPSYLILNDSMAILSQTKIAINTYTWSYVLPGTNIPSGQQDFYLAILHELGHALLLSHVNINPSLMYWFSPAGQTAGNRIDLRNSPNAVTDAQFIATESENKSLLTAKSGIDICPGTPLSPTNTHGSATSSWQVNIAWTDNSTDETGFVIERSNSGANNFTQVGTVSANSTSYTDNSVLPAQSYDYRVYSTNSFGASAKSNVATITTPAATLPTEPSSPQGSISSPRSILIQWADNSTNESGFIIERSTSPTSGFTQIGTVGSNVTTFTDATITQGSSYYYRVKAYNPLGSSMYSPVTAVTACLSSTGLATTATITGTYASSTSTTKQAQTITSSGSAIVSSGATLQAEATQTIGFRPGFSVKTGAIMTAHIVSVCGALKSELVDSSAIIKGKELPMISKINIFPNPTKGIIMVEIKGESFKFELYNSLGALVKKDEACNNQTQIDISNFATGMYFLEVKTKDNEQQTFTIVKE